MRDSGDGWLHELKHDGFHILAFKDGERVRLWSRNGRDWSAEFVTITEALRALPFSRVMLDGEAVAHCLDGLPHFHKLLSGDGQSTACFYAFDLIWLEAQDLGVLRDGDVVFLADFGVVAAAQRARCGATAGEQGDRDQRRHAAAPAVRSGPGP